MTRIFSILRNLIVIHDVLIFIDVFKFTTSFKLNPALRIINRANSRAPDEISRHVNNSKILIISIK